MNANFEHNEHPVEESTAGRIVDFPAAVDPIIFNDSIFVEQNGVLEEKQAQVNGLVDAIQEGGLSSLFKSPLSVRHMDLGVFPETTNGLVAYADSLEGDSILSPSRNGSASQSCDNLVLLAQVPDGSANMDIEDIEQSKSADVDATQLELGVEEPLVVSKAEEQEPIICDVASALEPQGASMETDEVPEDHSGSSKDTVEEPKAEERDEDKEGFIIDETMHTVEDFEEEDMFEMSQSTLERVRGQFIEKSRGFSLEQLETVHRAMYRVYDKYRDSWNRDEVLEVRSSLLRSCFGINARPPTYFRNLSTRSKVLWT